MQTCSVHPEFSVVVGGGFFLGVLWSCFVLAVVSSGVSLFLLCSSRAGKPRQPWSHTACRAWSCSPHWGWWALRSEGAGRSTAMCCALPANPTALLRAAPQVPLIVLPAIPVLQLYTPVECTVLPFFLSFCISVQSSPRSGHGAAHHLLLFLFSHCIPD